MERHAALPSFSPESAAVSGTVLWRTPVGSGDTDDVVSSSAPAAGRHGKTGDGRRRKAAAVRYARLALGIARTDGRRVGLVLKENSVNLMFSGRHFFFAY